MTSRKQRRKQLYYLINHEWSLLIRPIGWISLVVPLLGLLLVPLALPRTDTLYGQQTPLRYEQLVNNSGLPVVHLLATLACLILIALSWYRLFSPVRSIDRLYRLPLGIRFFFTIRLLSSLMGLLWLQLVQLTTVVLLYHLFYRPAAQIEAIDQGLYLAFRRSAYLRFLLPLNGVDFLLFLFSLCLTTILVMTGVNLVRCLTSRQAVVLSTAAMIVAAVLLFRYGYQSEVSLSPDSLRLLRLMPLLAGCSGLLLINLRWLHQRKLS